MKLIIACMASLVLLSGCDSDNTNKRGKDANQEAPATTGATTGKTTRETLKTGTAALTNKAPSKNLCEGQVTHADRVKLKRVAKPPFMKYYRDPAFGTRVIRITNSARGQVHKPAYSTVQAWSAEESWLLLYQSGGDGQPKGHVLYDGQNYSRLKELDIVPGDIEEIFWSHSDDNLLYYVNHDKAQHGQFTSLDILTNKANVIRDFTPMCKGSKISAGGDVQMPSYDDDLFGFHCEPDNKPMMFTYRISTDTVSMQPTGPGTPWETGLAPNVSPSGNSVFSQGKVLDDTLTDTLYDLDLADFGEHSSMGRSATGKDVYYQTVFKPSPRECGGDLWQGVGHLTEHSMNTGACRPVVTQSAGWPPTTSGTHVSALAHKRPGWVAMSSIGYGNFRHFGDESRRPPALMSEIYLVNASVTEPVLCRLAQHRSFGKDAENAIYKPYLGEPHATISPSGTRILFGSDWYDSGSVDSYVVELPAFERR